MKYYIVENIEEPEYNKIFLTKAKNKKKALENVYVEYGEEYRKKDFKALLLEDFYEEGDVDKVAVII